MEIFHLCFLILNMQYLKIDLDILYVQTFWYRDFES
jgi:hypothetical protein